MAQSSADNFFFMITGEFGDYGRFGQVWRDSDVTTLQLHTYVTQDLQN